MKIIHWIKALMMINDLRIRIIYIISMTISVSQQQDKKILEIVLKNNMPCPEWTIKYVQTLPNAMSHFYLVQEEYKKKYLINFCNAKTRGNTSSKIKKRNKKIFDIKLVALKELMINDFVENFCETRHLTIKKKNTIINNYFFKRKVIFDKQKLIFDKENRFIKNKGIILKALNLYFSFGDCKNDYFNKIGVLKYNSQFSRDFFLNTGKPPYEIIP